MSMEFTNNDLGNVVLKADPISGYTDELLTLSGAGTIPVGTLLARSTATDNLVLFVKDGETAGNGVPKAVLTKALTVTASGNFPIRPLLKGEVNFNRLVIMADGDNSEVDGAVLDALRSVGIFPIKTDDLSVLDNQ